jgi:hypothetical protein
LHQPPRRSINVATPDFPGSIGTPVGGRSVLSFRLNGWFDPAHQRQFPATCQP